MHSASDERFPGCLSILGRERLDLSKWWRRNKVATNCWYEITEWCIDGCKCGWRKSSLLSGEADGRVELSESITIEPSQHGKWSSSWMPSRAMSSTLTIIQCTSTPWIIRRFFKCWAKIASCTSKHELDIILDSRETTAEIMSKVSGFYKDSIGTFFRSCQWLSRSVLMVFDFQSVYQSSVQVKTCLHFSWCRSPAIPVCALPCRQRECRCRLCGRRGGRAWVGRRGR